MQFDALLRSSLQEQIGETADRLKEWQEENDLAPDQSEEIAERIHFFDHTTSPDTEARIGGVDGSGDFPVLSFEDTFVYFAVAYATQYRAEAGGPVEVGPEIQPRIRLTWLPESEERREEELDRTFSGLAGEPIEDVVRRSDYRHLKEWRTGRSAATSTLIEKLVRPHASDSGNLSIQLRSTAELGAARSLIERSDKGDTVLIDGTLSLPFVTRSDAGLFHEHLKRLCCVEARERGVFLAALSKSHGLPAMEAIEKIAEEVIGEDQSEAEHWYLRLPVPSHDEWAFSPAEGRVLPPPGAVTYLVRFHGSTPVMRLDVDRSYWRDEIQQREEAETVHKEKQIFESIDYMSHDMRAYGYPYPVKAAHDRTSLTEKERKALRSKLVDEALRRGVPRERLQDASVRTKHA